MPRPPHTFDDETGEEPTSHSGVRSPNAPQRSTPDARPAVTQPLPQRRGTNQQNPMPQFVPALPPREVAPPPSPPAAPTPPVGPPPGARPSAPLPPPRE